MRTWQTWMVIAAMGVASGGQAQTPENAPPSQTPQELMQKMGVPVLDEPIADTDAVTVKVGKRIQQKHPDLQITSIAEIPAGSITLYEFQANGITAYTNEGVDFILAGDLLLGAGTTTKNVTRERVNQAGTALFNKLPLEKSFRYKFGNGERKLVVFADPDCDICVELEKQMETWPESLNITVHLFPYPLMGIHPKSAQKIEHIWCTANPPLAWKSWMATAGAAMGMLQGNPEERELLWASWVKENPTTPGCPEAQRLMDISLLGKALGFMSSPTMMFSNGMVWNGLMTAADLENALLLTEGASIEAIQANARQQQQEGKHSVLAEPSP